MSNIQNEETTWQEDLSTPGALHDALNRHSWALSALGALLSSASLAALDPQEYFSGSCGAQQAEASRAGLEVLIELYLKEQKRILDTFFNQSIEREENLLASAISTRNMVDRGAYTSPHTARERLCEALEELDRIIEQDGNLKAIAEAQKKELLAHHLLAVKATPKQKTKREGNNE